MKKLRLLIDTMFKKVLGCFWFWFRMEIQFRGSLHSHYFPKFKEPSIGNNNLGNIIKKSKYHQDRIDEKINKLILLSMNDETNETYKNQIKKLTE
jgi:hypothetical protein